MGFKCTNKQLAMTTIFCQKESNTTDEREAQKAWLKALNKLNPLNMNGFTISEITDLKFTEAPAGSEGSCISFQASKIVTSRWSPEISFVFYHLRITCCDLCYADFDLFDAKVPKNAYYDFMLSTRASKMKIKSYLADRILDMAPKFRRVYQVLKKMQRKSDV